MSAPAFVPIGTISQFSILANSGVTGSAGAGTVVAGDVGSSPTPTITNFPPSSVTAGFTIHTTNDLVVQQARADAITAYNYLMGLTPNVTPLSAALAGQTVTSDTYSFDNVAVSLAAGGTFTLDGPGLFIFQIGSTLTADVTSNIAFINGALPCNVYWQVGTSATLNGDTFAGSIFADASITISSACVLSGRAIAGTGATGAVTIPGAGGNTVGSCASAAPVLYQIDVNYTPQTTGCHIICYGQTSPNTDDPLCCMVDTTASTPGVPKTFSFQVAVTPCNSGGPVSPVGPDPGSYVYDGYVRPCCAPEGTLTTDWAVPVTFVIAAP